MLLLCVFKGAILHVFGQSSVLVCWKLWGHLNVINVKLCMMVLHIELYLFVTLSVTLRLLQGHSSVKQFQLKISCSYSIKLKLCRIVKLVKLIMNIQYYFSLLHLFKKDYWCDFRFDKNFNIGFLIDTV